MRYHLYNDDTLVATFDYDQGTIGAYSPIAPELLPMQIKSASADGFALWLRERSIDLNTFQHRQLANALVGSRDKLAVAITTHMFSISDAFTCFVDSEFTPRAELCQLDDQDAVSDFILISSDTSLRRRGIVTPNASTDGSFPKTWKHEENAWWLYKLQTAEATQSEREISRALLSCGWDAAEYQYAGDCRTRIRCRNFVGAHEFFEPYDSFRFRFQDRRDGEETIFENIATLGEAYAHAYKRILLADALFMNTDRHMRNFGVMRSSLTGEALRMAPNFDNNQAYRANPGGRYSDSMLRGFIAQFGLDDETRSDLKALVTACDSIPYLADAAVAGRAILNAEG